MRNVRGRFWVEAGAGTASLLLAALTLVWHDWIEVTGWDPDQHSGAAEWLVVAVLATVALVAGVMARLEWRRSPLTS